MGDNHAPVCHHRGNIAPELGGEQADHDGEPVEPAQLREPGATPASAVEHSGREGRRGGTHVAQGDTVISTENDSNDSKITV